MRHKSQIHSTLLLVFIFLLPTASLAETADQEHDQKKLHAVKKELEQATKQREQQNARVDELSQRLECNWTLIRAYEICGELHKNMPDEHLKCSTIAKQNASRCLENSTQKD